MSQALALTEAHTRAADAITELLRGEPLPVGPSPPGQRVPADMRG
ncbi:hypothetical protein ACOBQB_15390 [Streptomyces sp. G5(2025)]